MPNQRAGDDEVEADANGTRYVDDGFGNTWLMCHDVRCDLHVVRPGKVQCNGHCDWHDIPSDVEAHDLRDAALDEIEQVVFGDMRERSRDELVMAVETMAREVNRLNEGLRRIAEGDYPENFSAGGYAAAVLRGQEPK